MPFHTPIERDKKKLLLQQLTQGVRDLPASFEELGKALPTAFKKTITAASPIETSLAGLIKKREEPVSIKERIKKGFTEDEDLVSALRSRKVPGALPLGLGLSLLVPGAGEIGAIRKGKGLVKTTGEIPPIKPPKIPAEIPVPEKFPEMPAVGDVAPDVVRGFQRVYRGSIRSIESAFKDMGKSGKLLANHLRQSQTKAELNSGASRSILKRVLKPLNETEKEAVVQILDLGELSADLPAEQVNMKNINRATTIIRSLLNTIGKQAQELGLEVKLPNGKRVPFQLKENYFPHIFPKDMFKGKNKAKFIEQLINSGQAQNYTEAERIIDNFIRPKRSVGNLETAREVNLPGWIRDPETALEVYVDRAYKRLSEAEFLGKNDEVAMDLIEKLRLEGEDYKFAQQMLDRTLGIDRRDETLGFFTGMLRSMNTITMLSLSAIQNLSQAANVAVTTNIVSTIKALGNIFQGSGKFPFVKTSEEAKDLALRTGSIFNSTYELLESAGGLRAKPSAGAKFLQKTGFTAVEDFNRLLGANAGKEFAQQQFSKLLKNPNNKFARRKLTEMGIDVEEALARGALNTKDITIAAKKIADSSQFRYTALDTPYDWGGEWGKVITQFKTFGRQHAKFLKEEVVEELVKHKNPGALLRLAAIYPAVATPLAAVRNIIRGKETDKDRSDLDKYIDAIGFMGGLGIFTDMVTAARFGQGGVWQFLGGPSASTGVEVVAGLSRLAKGITDEEKTEGSARPLARTITRRIPFVGPRIGDLFKGKKGKKKKKKVVRTKL